MLLVAEGCVVWLGEVFVQGSVAAPHVAHKAGHFIQDIERERQRERRAAPSL